MSEEKSSGNGSLSSNSRFDGFKAMMSSTHMDWAAPIINWSTPEVLSYLVDKGIVISPAYKKIGISGDCLCGVYARAGEAELVAKHYPEVAEQIRLLEEKAKGRISQKTWGNATSISTAKKQKSIEEYACFDCAFSD